MEVIKRDCIIVGAGTYGQVYAKYLNEEYNVAGFIDDNASLANTLVDNIPVLGNMEFLHVYVSKLPDTALFVPIGNNKVRVNILKDFVARGYNTPSYVNESTVIHETVQLGKAVYILAATNIMPSTVLGDYVMVSMGVNVAHHVRVGEGCFFSQGVNIGASISIGDLSYFGIASTVMTGIKTIGSNVLLGAGAVAIKDIEENSVMIGNPAKFLRRNS